MKFRPLLLIPNPDPISLEMSYFMRYLIFFRPVILNNLDNEIVLINLNISDYKEIMIFSNVEK